MFLLLFFFTIVGSFIFSSFSYNIYILYVTFGVMCGTAQSFLYHYFENKKALATSEFILLLNKMQESLL